MAGGPSVTPAADSPLTLITLGGWSLLVPGGTGLTPQLGPSKPLALLVYLALSPGRTAAREHLLDLLWADLDPSAATHAYRQTVWYIRRRIGDTCLQTGGGSITLACPVETDRDAFLGAVEQQDLQKAVELYRGDFLPGFAAPGGAEFEKWADLERYRLRGLFIRCAGKLVRGQLQAGHAREAVALARRVRDADRDSEAGWRLYLEALVSSGDTLTAAVEADQLERHLAAEAIEPDPRTTAALRLARQQPATETVSAPAGLVAELVGREREFGAIVSAWEACRRGAARHIHIVAAAGLGKTRLLTDAHTRLRAAGARALLLRATPGERTLACAFAGDLATALAGLSGATAVSPDTAGTLVALAPALAARYPASQPDRSSGEDTERRRLFALEDLAAAVADEAPIALLLDDIHWADARSRQLLNGLLGRLGRHPVLVVSTARPVPDGRLERDGTEHLGLEPLTTAQVGGLMASLGVLPEAPWTRELAERLRAASDGSPLTLIETLQLALERGVLALGRDGWSCPDPAALGELLASGAALRMRLERLSRDQRWLLLILATHGAPLTREQVRMTVPRGDDALLADLAALEQRGMVSRPHGHWQPAHDALADLACAMAGDEAKRAAHAALARAIDAAAGNDHLILPLAAQHYAAAGEEAALLQVSRRWIRALRLQGDRRPLLVMAQELLGPESSGLATRVVASLPLHSRIGLDIPIRIAAAVVMATAAMSVGMWRITQPPLPPPDATLMVRILPDSGPAEYRRLPLRLAGWHGATEELRHAGRPVRPPAGVAIAESIGTVSEFLVAPDGRWFLTLTYPDSGGQDIAVADTAGHLVRLTSFAGDDGGPDLSPDGRYLAFSTSAWNARMQYDIAVMDLGTRQVRQLTAGNDHDHSPHWSPDGTRIAFSRTTSAATGLQRLSMPCVVTMDATTLTCLPPDSATYTVRGWKGQASLIVERFAPGDSSAGTLDIATRRVDRLVPGSNSIRILPDGAWITSTEGTATQELQIAPVSSPDTVLRLMYDSTAARVLAFPVLRDQRTYIAALVPTVPDTLRVGVPFRPRVVARLASGETTTPPVLSLTADDPSVVSVDASGALIAHRQGTTTVRFSAGGWRDTALTVVAAPNPADRLVLSEHWPSDTAPGWHLYGYPRPQIVTDHGRRAFWNAGEGNFESGAYSLRATDARGGLGVEAWISAPLDSGQWQSAFVRLTARIDTQRVRTWNDRASWLPKLTALGNDGDCSFQVPLNEYVPTADSGSLAIGQVFQQRLRLPFYSDGRWFRARVQMFPDGRCGLAIDGRAFAISDVTVDLRSPYRVAIGGNSAWTRILVGPVEAWQGVRTDVDWTSVGAQPAPGVTSRAGDPVPRAGRASPRGRTASRAAPPPVRTAAGPVRR